MTNKIISPEMFSEVCYLVLMASGETGILSKAPEYIHTKKYLMEMGYGAFAALDYQNKRTAINWLMNWGFEIPQDVEEVYKEEVLAIEKVEYERNKQRSNDEIELKIDLNA